MAIRNEIRKIYIEGKIKPNERDTMTVNGATMVELVNLVMSVFILAVAIHARRKFRFVVFNAGWNIVAVSAAVMVVGSLFRTYYTYANLPELIPLGWAFLVADKLVLAVGICVLVMAAIKLWDEEGESERIQT